MDCRTFCYCRKNILPPPKNVIFAINEIFYVKEISRCPFFSLYATAGISSRSGMKNGHRNHNPDVDNTVDLLSTPLSLLSLNFDGEPSESSIKDRDRGGGAGEGLGSKPHGYFSQLPPTPPPVSRNLSASSGK